MRTQQIDTLLAAANPVDRQTLAALDLAGGEEEMLEEITAQALGTAPGETASAPAGGRRRQWRALALLASAATVTALVLVLLDTTGGPSREPASAYGAELVRFAESTPLLLLEGPGWRVQNADEGRGPRRGEGIYGSMEFVTGKPIPYESIRITGDSKAERESGMFPPPVRQRRVELWWRHGSLAEAISMARAMLHPHGQRWTKLPVLGTTAHVDTRAEFYVNQGGPGNRQMTALWSEDGYVLELKAAVPDLAAFEERLGWLTKVDSQTWLDAMPAKVVKAADHGAAVREMLKGIPVPSTFKPSRVPDTGLTTDRYQVGAAVTGTVSCLWFRQWGEARRTGDRAAAAEAEKAMATSRHWSILREMAKEGGYPEVVWELAAAMPSEHWEWNGHQHRLLPHAEGLGCARWGLPLLPRKQKLQRERGVPPPP
jgi:hypothetical protein